MERKTLFEDKHIGYHTFGLGLNDVVGGEQDTDDDDDDGEERENNPQLNPGMEVAPGTDTSQTITP